MPNCIIHVDGSSCLGPLPPYDRALGWGLVAQHDDQMHEASGGYKTKRQTPMMGFHEDIAVLHALAYMREHGFAPEDTSIYCDDDVLGYAPTYLAKENYLVQKAQTIEMRMEKAAKFTGHTDLLPRILDELQRVQMHKLKGHRGQVHQERVDYLAKWHARKLLGDANKQLSFEAWLGNGFEVYLPPKDKDEENNHGSDAEYVLTSLGLLDIPDGAKKSALEDPTKPRRRIQYPAFVRTIPTTEMNAP